MCEFALELSIPLCDTINISFDQDVVLRQWKKSIMVSSPKETPPTLDKLRPITLTDHFAKLAELVVHQWLMADVGPNIDTQ